MEPPADPSPATSTELEHLEKEQPLGEAANLGCPGFEAPNAVATAVSSGPTKITGKTAIPGGPATGIPIATERGQATAIPTATPRGSVTALTATTTGGAKTIQTETGKTGTGGGRKTGQKIEGIIVIGVSEVRRAILPELARDCPMGRIRIVRGEGFVYNQRSN
jgi:hypothetical protein